ncbi:hypothetical protein WL40_12555 [Burkholderia ubonensis]|uniref:hypothetical protein n=1 Tax=Burkholderia ubonensis TaxID=101571 RepID=UPI00075C12C2|nr:hypothetical protein [Burkholderia ubonensis]KWB69835.1 hypothetical protein WL40_12555 [Burkholderia ubonensis]
MTLTEFVNRLKAIDLSLEKSEISKWLTLLAERTTLLSEYLMQRIKEDGFGDWGATHNGYAFDLHKCDEFTIRLIFWPPVASAAERYNFIYGLSHSHDFELYAIGYSGDGYCTRLTEVLDLSPIERGEPPRLGARTEIKLRPGTMYNMRPFFDIHEQHPPERLSSSLSLIIQRPDTQSDLKAWSFDANHLPTHSDIGDTEESIFEEIKLALETQLNF